MRWEFAKTTGGNSHGGFTDDEMLRHMSDEGWDLVNVLKMSDSNVGEPHFYFKRPRIEGQEKADLFKRLARNTDYETSQVLLSLAYKIEKGELKL